mmetsp:Transcript_27786/g.80565  ORF Transcript_27786/g.80565 Transcript_27786/m.80565 type:complete len:217 (+) Transcript_27786:302-952(+)
MARPGRRLDRDWPTHFLRRLPEHDAIVQRAGHRGSPAMEAPPDDLRDARAARGVHDIRLHPRDASPAELRLRDLDEPEDAYPSRKAADCATSVANVDRGPVIHRRPRRHFRPRVHAAAWNARQDQRGGLHCDGKGFGLHRPGEFVHDCRVDSHEPIPERDRWVADGLPGRQPARSALPAHGRPHRVARGPGAHECRRGPAGAQRGQLCEALADAWW